MKVLIPISAMLFSCVGPAGGPVAGAADTHCDGVTPVVTEESACVPQASSVAAGAPSSDYGPTHDGTVADDDDCKYHMSWTSTAIRQNTNVTFTATASNLAPPGGPVVGLDTSNAYLEVFRSDTHPAPPVTEVITETSPGVIDFGPVQFDEKGTWTMRFHFFENCADQNPQSPHGHTAFYIEVP